MKYKLLIFFIVSINITLNGQNILSKLRLKRTASFINKQNDWKADQVHSKIKVHDNWKKKNVFFDGYIDHYKFSKSVSENLEKFSLVDLRKNLVELRSIFSNWDKQLSDTGYLLKKGYKISTFRNLNGRMETQIAKLVSDSLRIVTDSLKRDSIEKRNQYLDSQLKYRNNYEDPEVLHKIANEIPEFIANYSRGLRGSKPAHYILKAKKEGKNFVLTLDVFYEENLYGFKLGNYQSDEIDYPIKIFSSTVLGRIQPSRIMRMEIVGEADANIPNGLKYSGKNLGDINTGGFRIIYGNIINNKDLAYLRAYNAKQIFVGIVNKNVDSVKTIDHTLISDKNKGVTYRKITMTAFFLGYFTELYNKMSEETQKTIIELPNTIIYEDDIQKQ